MTVVQYDLAVNGYMAANGIKKPEDKFLSRNDLLDLIDKHG